MHNSIFEMKKADEPITVRTAKNDDYEQLCCLFKQLDTLHHLARPDVFNAKDDPSREISFISSILSKDDSTIIVAESSAKAIVGLVMLRKSTVATSVVRDERVFCEVDSLIVHDNMRNSGIGQALMNAATHWATSIGLFRLEASVWAFNTTALKFYFDQGFSIDVHRIVRTIA